MTTPAETADTQPTFFLEKHYKDAFEKIAGEKQKRIMDAAIAEFSAKGFIAANINIIAKKAGISIGSMYNYFASKESLFLTICDHGYGVLESVISSVDLEHGDGIFPLKAGDDNFFFFFNANGSQHSQHFGREGLVRFFLDHLIHLMKERNVLRMQRVDVFIGYIVIFHRLWICLFSQRIDLQVVLDVLDDAGVVIPVWKSSYNKPVSVSA